MGESGIGSDSAIGNGKRGGRICEGGTYRFVSYPEASVSDGFPDVFVSRSSGLLLEEGTFIGVDDCGTGTGGVDIGSSGSCLLSLRDDARPIVLLVPSGDGEFLWR